MASSSLRLAALCTMLAMVPAEVPSCVGNECEGDGLQLLSLERGGPKNQPIPRDESSKLTRSQCWTLSSHYFINYAVLKAVPANGKMLIGQTPVSPVVDSAPGAPMKIGKTPVVDSTRKAFIDGLGEFLAAYSKRPDKTNKCGMQVSHSFAVWHVVRSLKPTTIIESGVNAGHSTYMMRSAAPQARIISIDPATKPVCGQKERWIDNTNNEYIVGANFTDFAAIDWTKHASVDPASTLVFLDDHQNAYDRIPVLEKYGFRHLMFDDNYPDGEGDLNGWAMKQVLGRPDGDTHKQWLLQQFESYAEFPPVLLPSEPPCLQSLWGTRTAAMYEEPILDLQKRSADEDVLNELVAKLRFE